MRTVRFGAFCRVLVLAIAPAFFASSVSAQIVEHSRTLADLLASHPCNSGLAGRHTIVTDCDAADDLGDGEGAFSCFARCDGVDTWAAVSIGGGGGGGGDYVLLDGDADGQTIQGLAGANQARVVIGVDDSHAVEIFSDGESYSSLTVSDASVYAASPSFNNSISVGDAYVHVYAFDGILHLFGGTVRVESSQTPPTNANDPCTVGDTIDTATFHYYCHATDTWVRVAMAAW